jgi:hypothetical protein
MVERLDDENESLFDREIEIEIDLLYDMSFGGCLLSTAIFACRFF